jgi:hypothetical protein
MEDFERDAILCRRALAAYYRTASRTGATIVDQPAGGGDVAEHDGKTYVVLSNVRGTLAVYRVRTDGVLKRLRRWPEEVAER